MPYRKMVTGKIRWDWTFQHTPIDNWERLFDVHKDDYSVIIKMKEALKNPPDHKKDLYEAFKGRHFELK